jgi:hypothetical protein
MQGTEQGCIMVKRVRSPRGLVGYSRETRVVFGYSRENKRVDVDSIGLGEVLKGPEYPAEIRKVIKVWLTIATDTISAAGKNPDHYGKLRHGDPLDAATAAARMMWQLANIMADVKDLERQGVTAALPAIHRALGLALLVRELTIVDNEKPIAARIEQTEAGARGREGKAKAIARRNRNMALEYKKRRAAGSDKSDSALIEEIGAAYKLKRSASIAAIKAGLNILSGEEARPDE